MFTCLSAQCVDVDVTFFCEIALSSRTLSKKRNAIDSFSSSITPCSQRKVLVTSFVHYVSRSKTKVSTQVRTCDYGYVLNLLHRVDDCDVRKTATVISKITDTWKAQSQIRILYHFRTIACGHVIKMIEVKKYKRHERKYASLVSISTGPFALLSKRHPSHCRSQELVHGSRTLHKEAGRRYRGDPALIAGSVSWVVHDSFILSFFMWHAMIRVDLAWIGKRVRSDRKRYATFGGTEEAYHHVWLSRELVASRLRPMLRTNFDAKELDFHVYGLFTTLHFWRIGARRDAIIDRDRLGSDQESRLGCHWVPPLESSIIELISYRPVDGHYQRR